MPEPIDAEDFGRPHPTCREFVAQLAAWGFTERGQEHVHTVFRDPHGGTRRVLRSQLGRADPATVDKAARLAGVTPAQFWAGPPGQADPRRQPSRAAASRAARPRVRGRGVRQLDHVDPVDIKPFGRVRIDPKPGHMIEVIGLADGILARSSATERIADIKVSRHSCLTGYHTVWQQ